MRIEKPGKINDKIFMMGKNESCVYLVGSGDDYAILGGGLTYIVPDVLDQIETLGIDVKKIRQIIIHHSHFDHVGIVPFLTKLWPWVKVIASPRGKELLSKENIVSKITSLNQMFLSKDAPNFEALHQSLDIKTINVDKTVSDGNILKCGDLDLEIIDVPGHSSCSIAAYIPQEKALFASDAGGIPYGDKVLTAANSNFDQYQVSLKKMAQYPTDIHLSEHYGALTQEDGRGFMAQSIKDADIMRQLLEETYERFRDKKKTVDLLLEKVTTEVPGYFLPKEIISMILEQMTRFIARKYE